MNNINDIDSVIANFKHLTTSQHGGFDDLMTAINELKFTDGEQECRKLAHNYSRLTCLKLLVLESNILIEPLRRFLEKIDRVNQYYLRNINLDPDYYTTTESESLTVRLDHEADIGTSMNVHEVHNLQNSVAIIGESLTRSLNCNDPVEKLELVLTAYGTMLGVVERVGVRVGLDQSPDLDRFERRFKRRKL